MRKTGARHKMGGFTLPELMAVVVIVGILMAVALPMYDSVMRKARRSDGMRELLEMASREERFYAQNSFYTTEVALPAGLNMGDTISGDGFYNLSVVAGDTGSITTSFELRAVPTGPQTADSECATFTLTNIGERGVTGSGDKCW